MEKEANRYPYHANTWRKRQIDTATIQIHGERDKLIPLPYKYMEKEAN